MRVRTRSTITTIATCIAGATVLALPYLTALESRNILQCSGHNEPSLDRQIAACTALIRSVKKSMLILPPPYLVSAFANRGNVYMKKGQYERAIQDYGQALQLSPNYTTILYNRGEAFLASAQWDTAIRDFGQAIRLNPKDFAAFNERGRAYANKHEFARAIEDYNEAIRLKSNFVIAFNNRGVALRFLGERERATADFRKALMLNPNEANRQFAEAALKELTEKH